MAPKPLSDQRERFCQEYLIDFNATQAAIRANYSKRTAKSQGQRLLTIVDIQQRIRELSQETTKKLEITRERIIEELAAIGFANITDFLSFGPDGVILKHSEDIEEIKLRAVSEASETKTETGGSVKFKLHSKLNALADLVKYVDMGTTENGNNQRLLQEKLSKLSIEELRKIAFGSGTETK